MIERLSASQPEFTQRLAALLPLPRRPALATSRDVSRERLLLGEIFGEVKVAEGSFGVTLPIVTAAM
jgi:hypothetical protein